METLFVTLLFSIIVSDLIISVIAHMSVHNSVTFLKKVKAKILNRNQAIIAGVQTTTTIEEIFEHTVFETKKSKVPKILSSFITEVEKSDLVSILVSEIKDKRNFIHDLIFEKENKFLFSVNSLIYVQKFIKDIYLYLGFLFSALYLIKATLFFLTLLSRSTSTATVLLSSSR